MTETPSTSTRPGGEFLLGGRAVGRIGYGVMQLAVRPNGEPVGPAEATALLERALDLGVNHLDTAEFYGDGTANRMIRSALAPYTDDLMIVSKVGARHVDEPVPLVMAQKPEELRAAVESNLSTLDVDRLPVVNLRRGDRQPGIIATGDQVVDLDLQLAEMMALRDEGKIGAIGLSHVSLEQIEQALPAQIACVQNSYGVLDRGDEPMLELCVREGIGWAPYFPLGSAFPGRPKVAEHPVILEIAARLGATASQVGLAWLLQHAPNTLIISGTRSLSHLEENVGAGEVRLDADAIARLDALDMPGES